MQTKDAMELYADKRGYGGWRLKLRREESYGEDDE